MTIHEGSDVYAVSWQYFSEATDGFGTRLTVIAITFLAS